MSKAFDITPEDVGKMFRSMSFDCIIVWLIGLITILDQDWLAYEDASRYSPNFYVHRYITRKGYNIRK